jgi:hypothetical protein
MTLTLVIVLAFTEGWLLVHGRYLAAAALAALAIPLAFFALRRRWDL